MKIERLNIWGIENHYTVSDCGEITSLAHVDARGWFRKSKRIAQVKNRYGYMSAGLQVNGKQNRFLVHRLVAAIFIPNPENKPMVNHKNGIKHDNRVENLEWCTRSENAIHSFSIGLQCNKGDLHPGHKLKDNDIIEIRSKYVKGVNTHKQIAKEYGVSETNISDILLRKIWNHI